MRKRGRLTLFALMTLAVAAGLASRSPAADFLPRFLTEYAGDTLWASALYILLALIRPSSSCGELLLVTILISFAVEFSQLYQAGWINGLRNTFPLGHILGYGFRFKDLLCYTSGALLSFTVDSIQRGRKRF